jgi:hypothetical protein
MAEAVYILCAATSLACAVLLFRGYARSKARFLLWSGLCFAWLTANNVLLFVDKVVFPDVELQLGGLSASLLRSLTALAGLSLLLYGLIWDADG